MRRFLLALGLFAALLAGLAATQLLIEPPAVRASPEAGEFDAERAKARLAAVLGDERPHPTDSFGSDAVRSRLIQQLRAAGLNPIVRDQFACNTIYKQRGVTCARVRNVIVALGGAAGKALLLNTHYDSTPVGPAAADAGAGVATLIEVASILKDERLQRPLIFLFNEGEELGLVGARAFMADPLSQQVDSLINLEARGVNGPVSMFETSLPNGPPIRAFAESVGKPYANSLATDFYRQLPNYTDVNSFSERGWTTLNFAMIGNETRYHSAGDNLAALDPKSLQHMGDQTLQLARQLAARPPHGSSSVMFADIAGRQLMVIPQWLGFALLAALVVASGVLSIRRGGTWRGLALVVAAFVAAAGIAWLGLYVMGLARAGSFWRGYPIWTQLAVFACGLVAAAAALALIGRRLTLPQLRASFWLAYLLLGVAVLLVAPGGVIFFLLPPFVALLAMLVKQERVGSIIAAVLLWLTVGEVLALLGLLMNNGPFFIFAPLAMLIAMPWLIEAKPLVDNGHRLTPVAASAALMVAAWAAVAAAPAYSADRQQRFTVQHVLVDGKAYWSVLNDRKPLPHGYGGVSGWRWAVLPRGERKRWLAEAPPEEGVRPPQLQVVERSQAGSQRTVRFKIRPNGAESVTLTAPDDANIVSAGSGQFVRPFTGEADGDYAITCFGRSCLGATLQFTTETAKPLTMELVGSRRGLPSAAKPLLDQRPRDARPQYAPDARLTISQISL